MISEHLPPGSGVTPVKTKYNLNVSPFLHHLFLIDCFIFISDYLSLHFPHGFNISQLAQNMYSRKWKYDLGISNLKLQFKDLFFFCLENLTNVTDWARQSLRTYSKCYKRKSNQNQSTLSLKCCCLPRLCPFSITSYFFE